MRNYGDYGYTCNPHDDYMHVTGNTMRHRASLHFLWGKHLQCMYIHTKTIPFFFYPKPNNFTKSKSFENRKQFWFDVIIFKAPNILGWWVI